MYGEKMCKIISNGVRRIEENVEKCVGVRSSMCQCSGEKEKKSHLLIEDGLAKGFPSFTTASIDSVRMFHVAT